MPNFRVLASILTDIFIFLPEKLRKKGSKKGRDQDAELRICPKAKAELIIGLGSGREYW